ncbi:MAG: squalene/phytoene synthase family protein [Gammaproteobacteria bacterium]|nr:squalene/phytoene synthase family protein [Gammaproteobacteria bacterium]MCI0590024.1 squalene/phytoene synthase family protein [Gammaproteobacteria bacterium]
MQRLNPVEADDYFRDRVAAPGSSLYYSTLFLPLEARTAVTTLHAFGFEIDEVVRGCSDPGVARMKLQWWREEIQRASEGRARHPLGQSLHPIIKQYQLPVENFLHIIDCTEITINGTTYNTFSELAQHCECTSGLIWLMSTIVTGYHDPQTLEYGRKLGSAIQLATVIQDIRKDAAAGRLFIPRDDMQQMTVDVHDLLTSNTTDKLKGLVHVQIDRAREQIHQSVRGLPERDRWLQLHGVIMAEIVLATLNEIESDGYRVFEQHMTLTPLRKLWIAWRIMRREKRRRIKRRTTP